MTSIYECKQTLSNVNGVLRKAIFEGGGNLSNTVIAQLNDVAYKAINSKKLNKLLDKRAIKNEE